MAGLLVYALLLAAALLVAPSELYDAGSAYFILIIGVVGLWRYGWALVHLARALIYRGLVFPRWRRRANAMGEAGRPSHVYLLITSFRIDSETTRRVYQAALDEAAAQTSPVTIVASIVEMGDQRLIKQLFAAAKPPPHVGICFVRIPGTGKRDALASAFRSISSLRPPRDAVVCVIDGDTILEPGVLEGTLPFFAMFPRALALTTDETCDVVGSRIFREWYAMRFAQRQILMCSVGLSRRVLTLTGRMSAFRAEVVTDPVFIQAVEHDEIEHWRLGRIRFLTGDDKSSWFFVLSRGGEMLYIPDVSIRTVEHPPYPSFFGSATALMIRWFGNMLRTSGRAIRLGPRPMGLFTWWCIVDQRLSMWTTLMGPVVVILLSTLVDPFVLPLYLLWVALTRYLQAVLLLTVREQVTVYYPFLLYFNQVYGSLIKIYILFRLDRQKWTRQNTSSPRSTGAGTYRRFAPLSSAYMHTLALGLLVVSLATVIGVLPLVLPGDIVDFPGG
ncbi:MAG: glycosyltransferase [Propylenella sp.]